MLKKKLCKRCWNNYAVSCDNEYDKEFMRWDHNEEGYWKAGWIRCPDMYIKEREKLDRDITESPPENCPYFLENLL